MSGEQSSPTSPEYEMVPAGPRQYFGLNSSPASPDPSIVGGSASPLSGYQSSPASPQYEIVSASPEHNFGWDSSPASPDSSTEGSSAPTLSGEQSSPTSPQYDIVSASPEHIFGWNSSPASPEPDSVPTPSEDERPLSPDPDEYSTPASPDQVDDNYQGFPDQDSQNLRPIVVRCNAKLEVGNECSSMEIMSCKSAGSSLYRNRDSMRQTCILNSRVFDFKISVNVKEHKRETSEERREDMEQDKIENSRDKPEENRRVVYRSYVQRALIMAFISRSRQVASESEEWEEENELFELARLITNETRSYGSCRNIRDKLPMSEEIESKVNQLELIKCYEASIKHIQKSEDPVRFVKTLHHEQISNAFEFNMYFYSNLIDPIDTQNNSLH